MESSRGARVNWLNTHTLPRGKHMKFHHGRRIDFTRFCRHISTFSSKLLECQRALAGCIRPLRWTCICAKSLAGRWPRDARSAGVCSNMQHYLGSLFKHQICVAQSARKLRTSLVTNAVCGDPGTARQAKCPLGESITR